jgi:hypothetical protein
VQEQTCQPRILNFRARNPDACRTFFMEAFLLRT